MESTEIFEKNIVSHLKWFRLIEGNRLHWYKFLMFGVKDFYSSVGNIYLE